MPHALPEPRCFSKALKCPYDRGNAWITHCLAPLLSRDLQADAFHKKTGAEEERGNIYIFSSACLQVLGDNPHRRDRSEKFRPRLASRHPVLLRDTALAVRADTPVSEQKRCSLQPPEPISRRCDGQTRAKHRIPTCILFEPRRSKPAAELRSRVQCAVLWEDISSFVQLEQLNFEVFLKL